MFRRVALLAAFVLGLCMNGVCHAGLYDHPVVALMPFKNKVPNAWQNFGDHAGQATEALAEILSERYDVFDLVDREDLSDIVGEQSLGMTGLTTDGPGVGGLRAAEYKIYGSVTGLTTKENHVSATSYSDDAGIRSHQHRVFAHVALKLVEVKTGRIVLYGKGDGASTSSDTAVGIKGYTISIGTARVSSEQAYSAIQKAIRDAVYGKEGIFTKMGLTEGGKGGKR